MELRLDPDPDEAYQRVSAAVAQWADQVFDWLEETPINVRARRHRFSSGPWAVTAAIAGEDWLILWEPDEESEVVHVRYLGDNSLRV